MKKYLKRKIFSEEQIERLLEFAFDSSGYAPGATARGEGKPLSYDKKVRDVLVSNLPLMDNLDINNELIKFASEINDSITLETHFCKEIQALKYGPGGHFVKHNDTLDVNRKPRTTTTITLLHKSDDLEGGDLILYGDKPGLPALNTALELYESIVFPSSHFHECTTITKGERIALVTWVHPFDHKESKEWFLRKTK